MMEHGHSQANVWRWDLVWAFGDEGKLIIVFIDYQLSQSGLHIHTQTKHTSLSRCFM